VAFEFVSDKFAVVLAPGVTLHAECYRRVQSRVDRTGRRIAEGSVNYAYVAYAQCDHPLRRLPYHAPDAAKVRGSS
jgi:hypothetical protein